MIKKIINIYKKLPQPAKASFWFAICNVIQRGISLLCTPLFTRLMTTEQYGQYTIYQSWYTIISIFATFNLSAGVYNNGMVKWPESRKEFTSSMQGLSTLLTIILFVIYISATDFWNQLFDMSTIFMLMMFMELLFVPALNFWSAGQRFDYKYKQLILITLFIAIASPLFGMIAVYLSHYKAEARVISFVLVQSCIGLIFYIYNISNGKRIYQKKYWKFALSFTFPLIPHYLSQVVLGQSDRIMIQRLSGYSDAALYGVAYNISMMFTIVTNAINNSFTPYVYKSLQNRRYKELNRNGMFLVLIVAFACIIATAFGPEIIRIFASSDYYEAHVVVPPIAMSLLFIFIAGLFGTVEFFFEETKFIMVASSTAAIVNIILNYFGIKLFGYVATAYTTLICYVLLALSHYIAHKIVIKKKLDKINELPQSIFDAKLLFLISIVSLTIMILMQIIYDIAFIRYTVILLLVLISYLNRSKIAATIKEIRK